MAAAGRMRRYQAKDRLLGLLGPVSLLALLAAWLLLFLVGYALMLLPLTGDGPLAALGLAGSSLFTLGLAASPRGSATAVTFVAAATGLVVIALQIGYLPTIYGAYNRRETLVNMLESRAGEPAWGVELLAREQLIGTLDALGPFFTDWNGGPPTSPRATSATRGCCSSAPLIRCAPGWSACSRSWTPPPCTWPWFRTGRRRRPGIACAPGSWGCGPWPGSSGSSWTPTRGLTRRSR